MSTLKLAWRIGLAMSKPEEAFRVLRRFIDRHREVVDEVAFFETISHHLYLPLDFYREVAEILGRRIATLHEDGIPSAGINVLTTIGHLNEGWEIFPPLPFQPIIGHDGAVSKSCACPNSSEMRDFVVEKYTLFARACPDFIWVDDDIRLHHHGVAFGCFCPTCLEIFGSATGRRWEREALRQALNIPENGTVRAAWIAHNARTLTELMAVIAGAVHAVDPGIHTGLMTGGPEWTTYSGCDFAHWFPALDAVKARPGGGFYQDVTPLEMVGKIFSINRQLALTPATVTDRQYELENFPYTVLGKAVTSVIDECTLALAAGCNGIAFNALGSFDGCEQAGVLQDKEPLLRRIAATRPFWEELVARTDGLPLRGFWPAMHPQLLAHRRVNAGDDWFGFAPWYDIGVAHGLARLGIPLAPEQSGDGVILSGHLPELFSDDELRAMLAGPVLLDAFALEILQRRGLGELTGVRLVGWGDNGLAERLTADALNGARANGIRDIRAEFWNDPYLRSARLEPCSSAVRVLSVLETYLGERREPCVTAYENAEGGRVVVLGHAPWRFIDAKREPLVNLADWVMGGNMPVRIHETLPVVPLARLSPDRTHGAIVLLHTGLDPIATMTVEVRAPAAQVWLTSPGKANILLQPHPTDHGWSVELSDIPPWQVQALLM